LYQMIISTKCRAHCFTLFTDRQLYYNTTQFNYVDSGMNLTNRTWVVFQVKGKSDISIALGAQKFNGTATPTPSYELVFDWTTANLYSLSSIHPPAK